MPSVISQKFLAQDQVTNPGRGFTLAAKLLTQSWSMDVPVAPGTVGQSLRAVAPAPGSPDKIQLEWYTPSASILNASVGANLVLAGPTGNGYPGNPTFRDLEYQDLDQIVGTTSSTIAAGNDPRFHDQNTDVGTTSPTFQLNSTNGGAVLGSAAGNLTTTSPTFQLNSTNGGASLVSTPTGLGTTGTTFKLDSANSGVTLTAAGARLEVTASEFKLDSQNNGALLRSVGGNLSTSSPILRLDDGGTGLLLKSTLTGLELRNAADTDYANLRVANVVTGNEVNIGDNKVLLNADLLPTVTPTEDGGLSINRGNQVAAEMVWIEASQRWEAGVVGAMSAVSRYKIFQVTPAEVAAGVVAINHGYGTYVQASYWLPGNTRFTPAEETAAAGVLSVDFDGLVFAGVITVRVDG